MASPASVSFVAAATMSAIDLLRYCFYLVFQAFKHIVSQNVSYLVSLASVAVSAKDAQVVHSCGATLSEWNEMIKLYLVVRNVLEAASTNLAVSPNHFQHDVAWYVPCAQSGVFRLGHSLADEKDRANVSKDKTRSINQHFGKRVDVPWGQTPAPSTRSPFF
jgi:hypothetical protein